MYTVTIFLRILITQQNIVTVIYFMYTVTVFLQGTLCPDERSRTQTLASRLVALFENVSDSRAQFQIEQQGKNNAQKHCKSLLIYHLVTGFCIFRRAKFSSTKIRRESLEHVLEFRCERSVRNAHTLPRFRSTVFRDVISFCAPGSYISIMVIQNRKSYLPL